MDTDSFPVVTPVTEHSLINDQDALKHDESMKASDALPSPAADPVLTPTDDIKESSPAKESTQSSRTTSPSPSIIAGKTNMTSKQLKYCTAIIRQLIKNRDSRDFRLPVDHARLNIPDYPKIIKTPMDLGTVDHKLRSLQYDVVDEFVADVRLVFSNCYKFNGPESTVSMFCQNVESAFEKSLRQMPSQEVGRVALARRSSLQAQATPPQSNSPTLNSKTKKANARKDTPLTPTVPLLSPSMSRMDTDGRPKREIHPPPSKDYPMPMTRRVHSRKKDIQMKFCEQALREMKKSKYRDINFPFLVPVDPIALNIPDYLTIVKQPMDLATVENKLNDGEYATPDEFEADVRLMFKNCYRYNPPVLPVHQMGKKLEQVFDEKWKDLPQPAPLQKTRGFEGESEEEVEDDKIAQLERHIATISQQIASIKSKKKAPRSPSKSSRGDTRERGRASKKRPLTRRGPDELPEFSFEQKKELSERINNLSGDRLTTVVEIIQSSMPNLDGQGEEEIVLDIDALGRDTLHRLHQFVTGKKHVPSRGSRNKKRRTHYSEVDADKKIQELEKTLRKFGGHASFHTAANDSSSESDSESSSGSDSDDSGSSSEEM